MWKPVILAALLQAALAQASPAATPISLAGEWRFALDPTKAGLTQAWFKTTLPDTIRLPGTTDEARKGKPNTNTTQVMHLSRAFPYSGPAWYQRDVSVPAAWQGKRITLLLERTKHTTVWVDDQPFGPQDSLATSHLYDLTAALAPGKHRLTIRVNNGMRLPISGHQLAEDTQTDWNGILGRIELRATDPVWLEDVQVYPNAAARTARIRLTLGNLSGQPASGTITLSARSWNSDQTHRVAPKTVSFDQALNRQVVEAELDFGPRAQLWDEFSPALYRLTAALQATAGNNKASDQSEQSFGLRDFSTRGTHFAINGKTIFLRGKHDACVFPLTGYAPMDVPGWRRYFEICRSYGLNHVRFHTWCPPDAAFEAADIVGFYLQPELPNFGGDFGKDAPRHDYTMAESRRILQAFGHHPSFAMLALGNENFGGRDVRASMIQELRALDGRHLYAQASNYEFNNPSLAAGDDYWTTMRTAKGLAGNVRGSFSHADKPLGHIQTEPPSTTHDYSAAIANVPVPVIGHEVGQFEVFPNFREMTKYTGVLQPRNFAVFRQRLQAKGMLDQDADFVRASGALSVLCYREEVEAALRTIGFGGFQLLDLQDFPGQGTALVGILDAFMDSKNLITPEDWRAFCAPTVPLVRFSKYTWTSDETLVAQVQVANYGPSALPHPTLEWDLREADGSQLATGNLTSDNLPQGALTDLGTLRAPLDKVHAPKKLLLTVRLPGPRNHYDLWVYPPKLEPATPANVVIAQSLDAAARQTLASGGRVLLLPQPGTNGVEGFFASDFWCYPMFRQICAGNKVPPAPGTLGLLIQSKHPALAQFPTEFHSNWQWCSIAMHSRAMILDETPTTFHPIVQVIDNFERNHKLGLVLETKVGPGRLLVCGADLLGLKDRPEARQLLASLLAYAASDRFAPKEEIALPAL